MTKEEKFRNLISELFINHSIKINANESPKNCAIYLNKDNDWFFGYVKDFGYTSIRYKYVLLPFEKHIEEYKMKYDDVKELIIKELLMPLNLQNTILEIIYK